MRLDVIFQGFSSSDSSGQTLSLFPRWIPYGSLTSRYDSKGSSWHEGWGRGPEPMGMITWKHELLVVPFSGEWAA